MFTITKEFTIGSFYFADFMRLLGRYGVRFDVGEEWFYVDEVNPDRKHYCRNVKVYATRKKMGEIYDAVSILVNYHFK